MMNETLNPNDLMEIQKPSCHFPFLIKLIYGEILDTEEYKLWKEQQTPALGHKF